MAKLDALFRALHQQDGSDLHLAAGQVPIMRIHGDLVRLKSDVLNDQTVRALLREITPTEAWEQYEATGDLDFGYEIEGLARFRCNLFVQKNGAGGVFRLIPSEIITADQLGLPDSIRNLSKLHKGLVLVTGPTGSGKSTTLAAIIDLANKTRNDHILTIEDPVEFVHRSQTALVNHREVGSHTKTFASALRAALREDPDIILVGEMRDVETIRLAIEAASTGHLVFGTLHTNNAAKTVDRLIEVFPSDEQPQIRSTLADSLKAVIAQTLFKTIDEPGRVAALEIMLCTPAIANLVREGKTFQIPSAMQTGKGDGMQTLDAAIVTLLEAGRIDPETALDRVLVAESVFPFLPSGHPALSST